MTRYEIDKNKRIDRNRMEKRHKIDKGEIQKLNELSLQVSAKFKKLTIEDRNKINRRNLIESVRNISNFKGLDGDSVIDKYCLLKIHDITIEDRELLTLINRYWVFLQIDVRLTNPETYSYSGIIGKEGNLGRIFSSINFATILNYGFYLEIPRGIEKLDFVTIGKMLLNLEKEISEVESVKGN